jgi:hypothetical protein
MFEIKNNELSVQVIDPIEDKNLLGPRYCTGGYIFQVQNNTLGNLLSGPQFDLGNFNVFDGQGAPEVFETALNQDGVNINEDVLVIGVGLVSRTSSNSPFHVRDNPNVKEFTLWQIEHSPASISMRTEQSFMGWALELTRTLSIRKKILKSQTKIRNTGTRVLPIRWFAHPFFPFPQDLRACKFSVPVTLEPNLGYSLNEKGYIELKQQYDWKKGLYQKIAYKQTGKLKVEQTHPVLGKMQIKCDFMPDSLAIWANNNTFSFEPFKIASVQQGQELSWSISYSFF